MDEAKEFIEELIDICGAEYVSSDVATLERYSCDHSFFPPRKPNYVVHPGNVSEVQKIVKAANEHRIPVVPRSSGTGFHGRTIPAQGGIIVDLARMKQILEIDPRNRKVRIEPGVTYGQLQLALKEYKLMALIPLSPPSSKSVLSSHLEREPMLIPKYEYGDPLLTMEVVLPNGDILRTGSASTRGAPDDTIADLVGPFGPGLDFNRLFQGSQGTLGIAVWASVKLEYLPEVQKTFCVPFDAVEDFVEPLYRIQRLMLGNECLILNHVYLAPFLAGKEELGELKKKLPRWTLIICLAGGYRRPREKIEYEEEALKEIGEYFPLDLWTTIPGVPEAEGIIRRLREPWPEDTPYWKFRDKGACQTLSFHTTLDKIPKIVHSVYEFAAHAEYPKESLGCYIQPLERARACYTEFGLAYNPEHPDEVARVKALYQGLGEFLFNQGCLFTTPYGIQADLVYSRASPYRATLKKLKECFDPNEIMNPGKVCF